MLTAGVTEDAWPIWVVRGVIQGPILQTWGRPHFWSGDVRRPHFTGPMGTEVGGAYLHVAPPAGGLQQHQPEWDKVVTKASWRCEL